jgi:hypothetical protein
MVTFSPEAGNEVPLPILPAKLIEVVPNGTVCEGVNPPNTGVGKACTMIFTIDSTC